MEDAFWDTYQDRYLPKWSEIKTEVVNVDIDNRENIPSYSNFGSYKNPLLVEYAGQPKTCRLCEFPYYIYSECPKLLRNTVAQKQVESHAASPRIYRSDAVPSNRPFTLRWQTRSDGKNVPTDIAMIKKPVAIFEEAFSSDGESNDSETGSD